MKSLIKDKKFIVFLVCILTINKLVLTNCPSQNTISNFQANHLTFDVASNSPSNDYTSSVYKIHPQTKFTSKPYVALAIQSFEINNGILDSFCVQVLSSGIDLIQLKFRYKESLWKKITVNMWISTHSEIILGSLNTNLGSLQGTSAIGKISFSNAISNCDSSIARVFLNGFTANFVTKIEIQVSVKSLKQKQLEFQIKVGNGISLKDIYISYLIFSPSKANFDSYGGIIENSKINGQYFQNVHKNIGSLKYPIYGIVNMILDTGAISFSSNIDEQFLFSSKASRQIQKLDISYIIIGQDSKQACQNCKQGKIQYLNTCISLCPSGWYLFSYKNAGQSCKKCFSELNLEINSDKSGCHCKNGFIMMSGKCFPNKVSIKESNSSEMIANNDIKQNGASIITTVVQQPQQQSQQQTQPQIALINNGSSIINGYGNIAVGSIQNSKTINQIQLQPQSQPPPPPQQIQQSQQQQYQQQNPNLNQQSCLSIPNSYWAGYKCACKFGFKSQGSFCVSINQPVNSPQPTIQNVNPVNPFIQQPISAYPPQQQQSIYPNYSTSQYQQYPPYSPYQPQQTPFINPLIHQIIKPVQYDSSNPNIPFPKQTIYYKNGHHISNFHHNNNTNYNKQIYARPYGHPFDPIKPIQCSCGQNQVYNNYLKKCVCLKNYGKYLGKCRICPNNYYVSNGICIKCPQYSVFVPSIKACKCKDTFITKISSIGNIKTCICPIEKEIVGQECKTKCCQNEIRNSLGNCIPKCNQNQYLSPTSNRCECAPNFIRINGKCLPVCTVNQTRDANGICQPVCKQNQHLENKICVCDTGYKRKNGICVKDCVGNSTYVQFFQTCICNQGYHKENGVCVLDPKQCQVGFRSSASGCIPCQTGCLRCLIDDTCIICPNGFQPFGNQCVSICGDGLVVGTQQCDDRDRNSGDGCDSNCQIQPGFKCVQITTPLPRSFCFRKAVVASICGNGIIQKDQQCDDKGTVNGDGCSSTCLIQSLYRCNGEPSVCVKLKCGDGIISSILSQTCDDLNAVSGDGCSDICIIQPDYMCSLTQPSVCTKKVVCGNGVLQGMQVCDDGNKNSNDGCSSTCQVQNGWSCSGAPSVCTTICSDGLVRGLQQCDDKNTASGDGCSSTCKVETPKYTCDMSQPSVCTQKVCGDGIYSPQIMQQCDDGNTVDGDGCSSACVVQGTHTCTKTSPSICTPIQVCGNGKVQSPEQCDDGNLTPGDGCNENCGLQQTHSCTGTAPTVCTLYVCGDSIITSYIKQTCDDGNANSKDGCSSTCQVQDGFTCINQPSVCTRNVVCGNGVIQTGQTCDDSNTANGDGCDSTCQTQQGYSCSQTPSVCTPVCGDGKIITPSQQCDDGNIANNDGCSSTCKVQNHYTCDNKNPPSVCTHDAAVCGNGIIQMGQQCDDQNTKSGDGCSNMCKQEMNYSCIDQPSICTKITPACGNGQINAAEQCDDGNKLSGDGCSAACRIQPGYSCVLGTQGNPDTCNPICGDGKIVGVQQCDDGGTSSGNGCSSTCTVQQTYVCNGQPSVCSQPVINTASLVQFRQDQLTKHNLLRVPHFQTTPIAISTPALVSDPNLDLVAQAYAQQLVILGTFAHSNYGYGQNLYLIYGPSAAINYVQGDASQSWYDEIIDYDFNNPGFSLATGHFTQLVWVSTQRVGFGMAEYNDGNTKKIVIVAQYAPPGNVDGLFPLNVIKPSISL